MINILFIYKKKHRIYNIHYIKLHFSVVHSSIAIEILHISDLILRFYVFIHFAYELFPFRRFKWRCGSNNVIHNKFEYYFLIICRYLKPCKKMRGILFFLHQMENSQIITTITNLEQIMGEIYVIFIEFCMNVGRKMLELKSEMCK